MDDEDHDIAVETAWHNNDAKHSTEMLLQRLRECHKEHDVAHIDDVIIKERK